MSALCKSRTNQYGLTERPGYPCWGTTLSSLSYVRKSNLTLASDLKGAHTMKKMILFSVVFFSITTSQLWAQLTITTTSCPQGTANVNYVGCGLMATGGSGHYYWSLSSGSLPSGLTLSTSGNIAGKPAATTVGEDTFTVQVVDLFNLQLKATRPFFLGIFPALDSYQGLSGVTCTSNNYFHVTKISGRWMWCTPAGNVFWLFGVQNGNLSWMTCASMQAHYPNQGSCGLNNISGYFPWYIHSTERILSWGFNTWAEFSGQHFFDGNQQQDMPFTVLVRPAVNAENGMGCGGGKYPYTIKNVTDSGDPGFLSSYVDNVLYGEWMIDVFDPMWQACASDAVTAADFPVFSITNQKHHMANNHFAIGWSMDESDEYQYMKAFNPSCGNPPCANANTAYLIAIGNFCPNTNNGSPNAPAPGCTTSIQGETQKPMFSKYAWACGIQGVDFGWGLGLSYLQATYQTNDSPDITKLNSAWGTSYMNFCSTGNNSGSGWGNLPLGTGVMDENGTFPFGMGGCTSNACDPFGLTTLNHHASAIAADIEAFYRAYAKQSFKWQVYYVRNGTCTNPGCTPSGSPPDPNHLILSMNSLGAQNNYSVGCMLSPDPNVVLGMQDAGVQVFVGCYEPKSPNGTTVLTNIYNAVHAPVYPWVAMSAEQDSFWYPCPSETNDYSKQTDRGMTGYANTLSALFSAQGSDQSYPVIGIDWWGLTDDNGSSYSNHNYPSCPPLGSRGGGNEATNYGLISNNDNAYDGNCATIAGGTDAWNVACGGEANDYTNFLSHVTASNISILQQLLTY